MGISHKAGILSEKRGSGNSPGLRVGKLMLVRIVVFMFYY